MRVNILHNCITRALGLLMPRCAVHFLVNEAPEASEVLHLKEKIAKLASEVERLKATEKEMRDSL